MLKPNGEPSSFEAVFADPALNTNPYILRQIDIIAAQPVEQASKPYRVRDAEAMVTMEAERLASILTFGSKDGKKRLADDVYTVGQHSYSVETGAWDRPWLITPVEHEQRAIFNRFDELRIDRPEDENLRIARVAEHIGLIVDVQCQIALSGS